LSLISPTSPGLASPALTVAQGNLKLHWVSENSVTVALFLFASHSFLANYLRFMVKLIDKAIVINVKIHKNERKGFYSSNKENLIC
jgi:hypothetical protein